MGPTGFKATLDDQAHARLAQEIGEHRTGIHSALADGNATELESKIAAMGDKKTERLAEFLRQFINTGGEYIEDSWEMADKL